MKKQLSVLCSAAMLASLCACGGGTTTPETTAAVTEAAKTETTEVAVDAKDSEAVDISGPLVLYSSMTENDLNNLIDGFNEIYPDVEIEVVNGSAGELVARISAESANPQGDIMWGGLNDCDGDANSDLFEHWLSDNEDEIIDDYKSNNGFYNFDHLSTACICVNTELEEELGLEITSYADLLDPKLEGKIVFADPNSSSSAWNNVCNFMAVYGNDSDEAWSFIEGLMRNKMVIATSSSVCFKSVETGEYVVGLTYEDGAATLLKSGATNIRIQYPDEGASASAFGCGVIKGAPHMDAAKAMVNYLTSADGQNALGSALQTLRMTNKNADFETPYLTPTSEIKWVTRDNQWLIDNKQQILDHWNQIYAEVNN